MLVLVLAAVVSTGGVERVFPATVFHTVDLATNATLRIDQAPVTRMVATGDPHLVRCVTAEVRDGRLTIGWAGRGAADTRPSAARDEIVVTARADCRHEGDPQHLSIHVTAPAIDEVAISGQGIVRIAPIRAPVFVARIPGRGTITIDGLRADATTLSIGGSGRIAATGALGRLGIDIAGSGVIDTRAARAGAIDVSVAGHGTIAATVDGPASGRIGGHPICAIRNPGGGRIICPATPGKGREA